MFFSDEVGVVFEPFSLVHMILFICIFLGIGLIYINRKRLRNHPKERLIAKSMALFAFTWELTLYLWKIVAAQERAWDQILPIGLCAFTLYLGIYALFFKSKTAFLIGYFWTWGAIASVLFPDIPYSYDRFRFYQFMIGHMFFFFMYVYMLIVYQWYPTLKDWKRSATVLLSITLILIIISNITKRNLMFMLDADGTPFTMFEGHGYGFYLIGVITLSFAIVFVWGIPFYLYHRKKQSLHSQSF